jgi:hypothetical protein
VTIFYPLTSRAIRNPSPFQILLHLRQQMDLSPRPKRPLLLNYSQVAIIAAPFHPELRRRLPLGELNPTVASSPRRRHARNTPSLCRTFATPRLVVPSPWRCHATPRHSIGSRRAAAQVPISGLFVLSCPCHARHRRSMAKVR